MQKAFSKFFSDKKLPYIELRHSNSNKHYKEHIHETFSIGVNINGRSLYTNKNKEFEFKAGKIAIINPLSVHSCNSLENFHHEYFMMYLDKNWCYELQNSLNEKVKEFKPFSKEILEEKKLYEEFVFLCEKLFSEDFYLEKECAIINFFKKLFLIDLDTLNDKNPLEKQDIEDIINYFEKNFSENITLKELEEEFGLNSFYIIRLFNEKIGLSPHQFLLNLKINKSKELLRSGYSIVDTALECGFTDQSHFHRNFVSIVATTPRQFQLNFIQ